MTGGIFKWATFLAFYDFGVPIDQVSALNQGHPQHQAGQSSGRIEMRRTRDVDQLRERHDWPALKTIIVIDSRREIGARVECETRLYLTSSALTAGELSSMVRDHCSIETACIGSWI